MANCPDRSGVFAHYQFRNDETADREENEDPKIVGRKSGQAVARVDEMPMTTIAH
jgi:hypothetical protein